MLDEKTLIQLESALRRIFAMKITRSTFRELQNAMVSITGGSKELTNDLYESLFTAQPKSGLLKDTRLTDQFNHLAREFSVLVRLSKEVFERGEFVNIITSDTLAQGQDIAFLNRVRRIDGEEFLFLTDPASTVHLLQHFFGRIQELEKTAEGKKQLGAFKNELSQLSTKINTLAKS